MAGRGGVPDDARVCGLQRGRRYVHNGVVDGRYRVIVSFRKSCLGAALRRGCTVGHYGLDWMHGRAVGGGRPRRWQGTRGSMRTLLCAFWLGILAFQPPSHAQGDREHYREVAERRLAELGAPEMPGVAYAIVEQGDVSEIGATGVKRLGSDEPIGPDTPFLIGSISKSFTAIGVMQLVEAGSYRLMARFRATYPLSPTSLPARSRSASCSAIRAGIPLTRDTLRKPVTRRERARLRAAQTSWRPRLQPTNRAGRGSIRMQTTRSSAA